MTERFIGLEQRAQGLTADVVGEIELEFSELESNQV